MANGAVIPGFDYLAGKAVQYTSKEWRAKYPPSKFTRGTAGAIGETWYRIAPGRAGISGHLAAEAYAIIPAGKVGT